MFEHFHASDRIERAGHFRRQRFDTDLAVIDVLPRLVQMQACDFEHARRQIDAHHVGTATRERFAENAAAAPDIEHARALQPNALGNVVQPCRIQVVQRARLAIDIPPSRRELVELGGLG